jgi:hypothetical protein
MFVEESCKNVEVSSGEMNKDKVPLGEKEDKI